VIFIRFIGKKKPGGNKSFFLYVQILMKCLSPPDCLQFWDECSKKAFLIRFRELCGERITCVPDCFLGSMPLLFIAFSGWLLAMQTSRKSWTAKSC